MTWILSSIWYSDIESQKIYYTAKNGAQFMGGNINGYIRLSVLLYTCDFFILPLVSC